MNNYTTHQYQSSLDIFLEEFANWVVDTITKYMIPYLIILFVVFMVPTILGISSGVHEYYAKILKKLFDYANQSLTDSNDITLPAVENDDEKPDRYIIKMNLTPEYRKSFEICDICPLVTSAIYAIVDDNVTKRFSCQELKLWNILKRSKPNYFKETMTVNIIWWFGFIYRYFILLPNRIVMFCITLLFLALNSVLFTILPQSLLSGSARRTINVIISRMTTASLSIKVNIHGKENIPNYGICVANHTTPIDAIILCSLRFFTMTGQQQGGFFGLTQLFFKKSGHIFFERSQALDRNHVTYILREHASNHRKPPIILFPEGTCINNTSVMIFRKGCFEITDVVYPISIKYRSMYGDAFWNSSKEGLLSYLIHLMSCWMIYCDISFLPPVYRKHSESTIGYASRTRHLIAKNANLVELDWDGNLKRTILPSRFKDDIQAKYAKTIIIPSNKYTDLKRSCQILDNYITHSTTPDNDSSSNNNPIYNINFCDDTSVGIKKYIYWQTPWSNSNQ